MLLKLSTPTTTATFDAGTADTKWDFEVSGTQADGTPYGGGVQSDTDEAQLDLPNGVYTLTVIKNGISSLPSDPFTVAGAPAGGTTPVTLTVPDATQKAVIVAA